MKPARAGLGLALCVALTASAAERAPFEEFRLAVDPDLGAEMGMLAVTSPARLALRGVDFAAERWKPSSPWAGASLRTAELVLVDAAIAAHANLLTHELFGHGARAREIGLAPTYELSAPLPYAYLLSRGGFGGFGLRLSAELRRPPYFIGIEAGGKTEGIVDASPVGPTSSAGSPSGCCCRRADKAVC